MAADWAATCGYPMQRSFFMIASFSDSISMNIYLRHTACCLCLSVEIIPKSVLINGLSLKFFQKAMPFCGFFTMSVWCKAPSCSQGSISFHNHNRLLWDAQDTSFRVLCFLLLFLPLHHVTVYDCLVRSDEKDTESESSWPM